MCYFYWVSCLGRKTSAKRGKKAQSRKVVFDVTPSRVIRHENGSVVVICEEDYYRSANDWETRRVVGTKGRVLVRHGLPSIGVNWWRSCDEYKGYNAELLVRIAGPRGAKYIKHVWS
ncbi:hypothetical protein J7L13_00080 [bacterium]|nr:hypothetical protein [bacterium]